MNFIYNIFSFLIWPIAIIAVIIFFVRRRRQKSNSFQDKEWYSEFVLSKEDLVSQLFLLISFFLFGITLSTFNRDFNEPLSLQSVLLITSSLGLICAYYFKTVFVLLFSLLGLVSWWGGQAIQWINAKDIEISAFLAGLCFLALILFLIGRLHESQKRFRCFAFVYLVLGIVPITGVLFYFSTQLGMEAISEITKGTSILNSWQLTLSLFIILILLVGATFYTGAKKILTSLELLIIIMLACLFGIMAFLPEQTMFVKVGQTYYYDNQLSSVGFSWAIIYNISIFLELLGLIFVGYLRHEKWLINFGISSLFLLIIVKYFDWFFTFLDKSIFFVGAGILLFVVGWFMEKGRKYMISNIKEQIQQTQ